MTDTASDSEIERTNSKVGKVIQNYELNGLGQELERRWTTTGDEQMSLRSLADLLNKRVLRAALVAEGVTSSDREVAHLYETLHGDVSAGDRIQKERELEREGIDVEQLKRDFVSHQAVHTYLKDFRGAEYDRGDAEPKEKKSAMLRRLRSRATTVTEQAVNQLSDKDEISVGETDAFTEIRVRCTDCEAEYEAVDLIQRGGCDCE